MGSLQLRLYKEGFIQFQLYSAPLNMQSWHFSNGAHPSKLPDVFHYNDHRFEMTGLLKAICSVFLFLITPRRIVNTGQFCIKMQKNMMSTVKMILC